MVLRLARTRRRRYAFAALLLSGLAPALTEADPAAKSGTGQYLDISPVGVPVISRGRLVNYVFVTLRLTLRPGADPVVLRQKEPYFRDALVRFSHRTPLNPPGDLNRLDDRALRAEIMAESVRIIGPGVVTAVLVEKEIAQRKVEPPS